MMGDEADLPNSVPVVLESFQDPKFVDRVESLININIPLFAQTTLDGSQPHEWANQFRKYKKLYEDQLQLALATSGVEVPAFIEYVQQCSDAYSGQPGYEHFDAMLSSLTASEDYDVFLSLMFAAVRDNWVAEEEGPELPPNVQVHPVNIVVPEGSLAGSTLQIAYLGQTHNIVVPEGAAPGHTIRVDLHIVLDDASN